VALAVEHFGTLAGAILCHGVAGSPRSIPGFGPNNALTSVKQIKFVNNINYLGVVNVVQKVVEVIIMQEPLNEDGERGTIILVSSVAGLDGSGTAYGPSKGTKKNWGNKQKSR
jgi:NAD(P)-dependent dehydrogenase (short-subunit alcohol dehydrogenase family)